MSILGWRTPPATPPLRALRPRPEAWRWALILEASKKHLPNSRPFSPSSRRGLQRELFGLLPSEVRVVAAEVAVRRRELENGLPELEIAHDAARAEVKVCLDDLNKLGVALAVELRRGAVQSM